MATDWRHERRAGRACSLPGPQRLLEMRAVLQDLVRLLPAHDAAHGYVHGRSRETALHPHLGCRYLLHLDIVQFFRSTHWTAVVFGLANLGLDRDSVRYILQTCLEDEYLPVGPPTSPALSNVACRMMDAELSLYPTYTRYSDQLIFSSNDPIDEGRIRRTVRLSDYRINERKSWLRVRGRQSLELLGYVIGENRLVIPRRTCRRQRSARHNGGLLS